MLLGAFTHIWLLAEPIHDEIYQKVNEEMRTYLKEKAVYDTLLKERPNKECPKPPINSLFLITGNNTGTGITQNLIDSSDAFFDTLGQCFTRKEVIAKTVEMKIKKETATSWLHRLLKKNLLVRSNNKRGVYKRVH